MKRIFTAALLLATLSGCAIYREATSTTSFASSNWRQVATDGDRDRLRGWHKAWDEALAAARTSNATAIAADPLLFDPDRALADATIPAANYRCRVYKLGAVGSGLSDFAASEWFDCAVADEEGNIRFEKLTGAQRPAGSFFADVPSRQVFLGTLMLGEETAPLRYGLDATRDTAAYLERIAPARWRLVFPRPRFESMLDIIELVPAG